MDLKGIFAKVSGPERPGTYLVGFRSLDGSTERSYIRLQVTDLCLSTVESKKELMFTVTSMSTGRPVADAEVSIDALKQGKFASLLSGKTNAQGMLVVEHGSDSWARFKEAMVKRVIVKRDDDVMVLDSRMAGAPPEFANNHWYGERSAWLDWLSSQPYDLGQDKVSAGFVFTERPIYRPDETVYFKGIVRTLHQGAIQAADALDGKAGYVTQIQSPMGVKYEFPHKLSEAGTFNDSLTEDELPTGDYQLEVVRSHPDQGQSVVAGTSFKIEAYRIPKFEVRLQGPEKTPNDRPVSVKLTASYYAGGKVAGQSVAWKVVSYPFSYAPAGVAGYILSTDSRYGAAVEEHQEGTLEQKDVTDENGQATLVVNPQSATGGNPRKYVCETTVTDVDEQTVSNRLTFLTLPPFVLGLKVQRHITGSSTIKAEVATLGLDGKFEAGHKVSVQLKKMSWISYLQETDFSRGKPKYRTQESMELIAEKSVSSLKQAAAVEFANQDPGVYVLELSSRDRLGRLQTVKADLYLAGDKPVSWKKSDQMLFETVPDKTKYLPGQEARILLKSPFRRAMALAVIERPNGSPDYRWIEIADGQGTLTLPITPEMAPKIPVSFLLMRPRISDEKRTPDGANIDAGRPQTVANTTWLNVDQVENTLKVALDVSAHGAAGNQRGNVHRAQGCPRSAPFRRSGPLARRRSRVVPGPREIHRSAPCVHARGEIAYLPARRPQHDHGRFAPAGKSRGRRRGRGGRHVGEGDGAQELQDRSLLEPLHPGGQERTGGGYVPHVGRSDQLRRARGGRFRAGSLRNRGFADQGPPARDRATGPAPFRAAGRPVPRRRRGARGGRARRRGRLYHRGQGS